MTLTRATKLRRFVHRSMQRLAPGSLILLYHRIARAAADPWSLCVSPAHFSQHLDVLCGRFARLADLTGRAPHGTRAGVRFAITFDDGYADVLHAAKPLLEQYDAPATVFVATEGVDTGQPFWWDELAHIMTQLQQSDPAQLERNRPAWLVDCKGSHEDLHRRLHEMLGKLETSTRRGQLATLRVWAGVGIPADSIGRCLDTQEIRQLAVNGIVEVGAHTVSHRKLPALSPVEQELEIRNSRNYLEELTDCPVTSFAYPHGCNDATSRRLLADAGFQRACTSSFGRVRPGTDVFRVPRLTVPDCDGDAFARILQRLGF